jgi:hypothetical protein
MRTCEPQNIAVMHPIHFAGTLHEYPLANADNMYGFR